jgi:hypothetical protein
VQYVGKFSQRQEPAHVRLFSAALRIEPALSLHRMGKTERERERRDAEVISRSVKPWRNPMIQ